jgi:hypothetical protein
MTVRPDRFRYYASRAWRLLCRAVHERGHEVCERCRFFPIQVVHHVTYERFGHELLEDLLGLCDACHDCLEARSELDPVAVLWAMTPEEYVSAQMDVLQHFPHLTASMAVITDLTQWRLEIMRASVDADRQIDFEPIAEAMAIAVAGEEHEHVSGD